MAPVAGGFMSEHFYEFARNRADRPLEDGEPLHQPNGTGRHEMRFRFIRFRDIELDTAPPYLVHELIPRVGIVVVWGKPKSGKTFWVFDLEMHVALGWLYHGRRVEGGDVLHIACEGVRGLAARKEAWRLHHIRGKDPDAIAEIENAPFHLCKDTALDLINDVDSVVADIVIQFDGRPIKIITIDTLNRSLHGSENKDEDMARYIRAAVLLAEKFQCVVMVVHHCGYDTSHPRGHTALIGAVDADIEVKRDTDDAICTKVNNMRDGASGEETATRSRLQVIEVTRDDNGNPITSCVILPAEPAEKSKVKNGKAKAPTARAKSFYQAFSNAAAVFAKPREASSGRPSITNAEWIAQLDRSGLLEAEPPADAAKEIRDR